LRRWELDPIAAAYPAAAYPAAATPLRP